MVFKNGYIKEDENNYYVIIGAEDKLQEFNNGSPIPPKDDNIKVGENHLLVV